MVSRILDEATPIADAIEGAIEDAMSDCPSGTFACDANDITLAALGIAAGAASLVFVFFLMTRYAQPKHEVSSRTPLIRNREI